MSHKVSFYCVHSIYFLLFLIILKSGLKLTMITVTTAEMIIMVEVLNEVKALKIVNISKLLVIEI